MTTLTAPAPRVNTSAARVDRLLAVQGALTAAGFYPTYTGRGFTVVIADHVVLVDLDRYYPDQADTCEAQLLAESDDLPELDDMLAPDAEDALVASWSDGQLRDSAFSCWVEQYDRAATNGTVPTAQAPECTCALDDFPAVRYASEGLNPRTSVYLSE